MSTIESNLEVKEFARLFMPGALFSDSSVVELQGRSVEEIAKTSVQYVYAIETHKAVVGTAIVDGRSVVIRSEPFDVSNRTYVGGVVYNLEQVKAMDPDGSIAYNMEVNDYPQVIQCRTGNWQPFNPEKGDRLIRVS